MSPRTSSVRAGQISQTGVLQAGEERRLVTVLFGDLSGFTSLSEQHDAEEIKAALDATFRKLGGAIELHGGSVDKFVGDAIMATFGAPVAHEDDAERAVRAALAMREVIETENRELEEERGFRFEMRIGINTGEVMAGRLGADRADAYTVMGDAVNVAARLEKAAAPGEILVGPETRELCSEAIRFSRARRISAKGKASPIEAYEVIGAVGAPVSGGREREKLEGKHSPFVGRQDELTQIVTIARAARDLRRPHFVTLLGEPGVGKTRILEEAARRLEPDGFEFYWGRAAPYGSAAALAPAEEMVRAACGVVEGDDVAVAIEKIEAKVGELLEESPGGGAGGLARRLVDAIGLRSEAATRLRTREAAGPIERFFEELAKQGPVALVFDDLHWGDEELLDLVEGLPDRTKGVPLVVIASARSELIESRPGWGGGKRQAFTMGLEPLGDEESRDFVSEVLKNADPPGGEPAEVVSDLIVGRAGGNPLFLAELTEFLLSEGILRQEDRVWVVSDEERVAALPHGLRSVVAARLDSISVDDKELLQVASVVGETFWAGALAAITGISEEDLDEPLARLVEQNLLVSSGSPSLRGEREFRFRHGLTRDAAYRTLPRKRRARLHTIAGAWLEARADEIRAALASDDVDDAMVVESPLADPDEAAGLPVTVYPAGAFLDQIAYHYEQAARLTEGEEEDAARARAHTFLAGAARQAVDRALFIQADVLYQRAHEMADPTPSSLEGQGAALFGLGKVEDAERIFDDAHAAAVATGDREAEARILRRMADLRQRQSRAGEAVELAEQSLATWEELGDKAGQAETLLARGRIYLRTGRSGEAFDDFGRARAIAAELGNRRQEAWALQNMAWCRFNSGHFGAARELVEESLLRFSSLSDVDGIGSAIVLLGWIDTFDGRLTEPRSTAESLKELAHEIGEYWGEGLCSILACLASVTLGESIRGRREGLEALRILSDLGDRWGQAVAGLYLAYAEAALGRPRDASEAFMEALGHARGAGDPVIEASILYFWAWHLLAIGDVSGAAARAADALVVSEALPGQRGPWTGESMRLAAAVADRVGMRTEAMGLLRRAAEDPGEESHTHSLSRRRSLGHLAMLQVEEGDAEGAIETVRCANSLYSEDHESRVTLALAEAAAHAASGKEDARQMFRAVWEEALAGEDVGILEMAAERYAAFLDELEPENGDEIRDAAEARRRDLEEAGYD